MLIKLADGLLINPERISVIETKKVRGNVFTVIWIDGRSYQIPGDSGRLINDINTNLKSQYFAG